MCGLHGEVSGVGGSGRPASAYAVANNCVLPTDGEFARVTAHLVFHFARKADQTLRGVPAIARFLDGEFGIECL